jgi:hypothetical protein
VASFFQTASLPSAITYTACLAAVVVVVIACSNHQSLHCTVYAPPHPPPPSRGKIEYVLLSTFLAACRYVTLWSKRSGVGPYVEFIASDENIDPGWHPEQIEIMDKATNFKVCSSISGPGQRARRFVCSAYPLSPCLPGSSCTLTFSGLHADIVPPPPVLKAALSSYPLLLPPLLLE